MRYRVAGGFGPHAFVLTSRRNACRRTCSNELPVQSRMPAEWVHFVDRGFTRGQIVFDVLQRVHRLANVEPLGAFAMDVGVEERD
jgi:hypothetical protein